jgi:hypothetical protein
MDLLRRGKLIDFRGKVSFTIWNKGHLLKATLSDNQVTNYFKLLLIEKHFLKINQKHLCDVGVCEIICRSSTRIKDDKTSVINFALFRVSD